MTNVRATERSETERSEVRGEALEDVIRHCNQSRWNHQVWLLVGKKGKHIATSIHVAPRGTLNIFTRGDKNALSYTSVSNTPARQTSRTPVVKANGRQDNMGCDHLSKVSDASVKQEGRILLFNDPRICSPFPRLQRKMSKKQTSQPDSSDTYGDSDPTAKGEPSKDANDNGKKDSTLRSAVGNLIA